MKTPVFLLAPDSFKESMTAKEACEAMEKGIKKIFPDAKCIHVPMADGGEGTMQALVDATGGKIFSELVTGPLGDKTVAQYGILGDGTTAIIEMASASGLHLVPKEKRDPLITTTFGTGELINAALGHGIKKLIVGIGGSATNDGGAGMAQALGAQLSDSDGKPLAFGGGSLHQLSTIDISAIQSAFKTIEVEVACDVTNPLTGTNGASAIYSPQKGATPEMIPLLDANLRHYAQLIKNKLGKDIEHVEGAGAAGGMGAGLMAFLNAKLEKGIGLVIKYSGLEEKIKQADIVFTGEGSVDYQTAFGKTLSGVASLAKLHQKPVVAFAGKVGQIDALYEKGISAVFGILPSVCTLEEALKNGPENLEEECEQVCRLLSLERLSRP